MCVAVVHARVAHCRVGELAFSWSCAFQGAFCLKYIETLHSDDSRHFTCFWLDDDTELLMTCAPVASAAAAAGASAALPSSAYAGAASWLSSNVFETTNELASRSRLLQVDVVSVLALHTLAARQDRCAMPR